MTMPNRFIDTEFFKRPFVRGLEAPLKTLYAFIICDCDNAGIWSPDFEIASIYIGQRIEKKAVETAFKNKIIQLENGQWFFPDFIEHQYPKGLQDTNPAHNKIIKRLTELNLIDKNLKVHPRPSNGSKVMVEDKVVGNGKEEVKAGGIVKGKNKSKPDINECIDYLTEKVGSLDGTQKENRFACNNLLKKLVKMYPEHDGVLTTKGLIGLALNDSFHKKNTTSFAYLLKHTQKIINLKNNGQQNTEDRLKDITDLLSDGQ